MQQSFKNIQDFIQQNEQLSQQDKEALLKSVGDANEEYAINERKLEQKTRELEIEAALEKVRTVTMAMHTSEELKNAVKVVLENFQSLGLKKIDSVNINIFHEGSKEFDLWLASPGQVYIHNFRLPYLNHPIANDFFDSVDKNLVLHKKQYAYEEKNRYFEYMFEHSDNRNLPEQRKEAILNGPGYSVSAAIAKHSSIFIHNYSGDIFSAEDDAVLIRFCKVFDQAYDRFLDLQKAEAQTREARIEAALERVRSKTMAMQESSHLQNVIMEVTIQLEQLGFNIDNATFSTSFDGENSPDIYLWMSGSGQDKFEPKIHIPFFKHPLFTNGIKALLKGESFFSDVFNKEEKDRLYRYLFEHTGLKHLPAERKQYLLDTKGMARSVVFLKSTALTMMNYEAQPYNPEENEILKRMGYVFDQAYTRFKDLEKSEAHAREAQIELGLERVRARALAMHNSDELEDLVTKVFEELTRLDLVLQRCMIMIFDPVTFDGKIWLASPETNKAEGYLIQYNEYPFYQRLLSGWKERNPKWIYVLEGQIKKEWDRFLFNETGFAKLSDVVKTGMQLPGTVTISASFNSYGALSIATLEPLSDNHFDILLRFAKVFDLTYTRFNDLQKAEAQTREAIIEVALERVRSKTMAMHSSRDVGETAVVMFKELEKLHVAINRCGILIFDDTKNMEVWTAAPDTVDTAHLIAIGSLDTDMHPLLHEGYISWKNKEPTFFYYLQGQDLINYYTALSNAPGYPYELAANLPATQACSLFYFPEGGLYAFTAEPLTKEDIQIFSRFAGVFALTYRRYLELQVAENQARQAIKQASLDRVRAEIASMRSTADLEKIIPLIWTELTTLGVPFIRCGVFIMDEQDQETHTFLSTPDGHAIASFQMPYSTPGTPSQVLLHWRKKEMFKDHWDEADFTEWTKNLVQQGAIDSSEKYSTLHPPTNLELYFLPFLQGMLYVGSEAELSNDKIHLIQTLADAFSTAYARYEDFNKLESAKEQVEKTLVHLKLAQAQLVQSEKMASLGELTAGIAHEIQNPLNFVNNFSDINTELLVEMVEELEKGNAAEAKQIANSIEQNLQKINHHGKRADAIVKGMLQHSRLGSGKKEPTDMNALADEYLRLSYHGLRAKDKNFNADFKTSFGDIGKIEVMPQDIGRALLNFFTNAFYSVREKTKLYPQGYEPMVTVSTRKLTTDSGAVEIRVKDNGMGIPQKVLDKIYQPFFTTKPTGQGTGLGLSLSYDIIKAHGGEIKVETKEGEGAEFIIHLPV